MSASKHIARTWSVLLPSSIGLMAIVWPDEPSFAQMSEIDAYDRAVSSQSKDAALAFLNEFRSSHLVGDLIESLHPDTAREVCASLHGSGPRAARRACTRLPQAAAAEPADRPASGGTGAQNAAPAGLPAASVSETMTDEEMMSSGIGEVPAPSSALPAAGRAVTPSTAPAPNQGTAAASSAIAAQVATMPSFRIQLLSTKSAADTHEGWRQLLAVYPDLLAGFQFEVVEVDLGAAKGVWYRGFAGPIADRDEANMLCTIIRSRPPHNDCLVAGHQ
jgi:hypothetical protein